MAGRLEKVLEPAQAEIIACPCLQAIQRAIELGIQKITLETDAAAIDYC
jgi:hypothetical protein